MINWSFHLPRRRHLCVLTLLGLLEEVSVCHADISPWKSGGRQGGGGGGGWDRARRAAASWENFGAGLIPGAWAAPVTASPPPRHAKAVACDEDDRSCRNPAFSVRGGDAAVDGAAVVGANLPLGLPLWTWKILFQVVLTSINVFFWLIPLRSPTFGSNEMVLSLANAFSGGVFLSLAFGHLIPEAAVAFREGGVSDETLPHLVVLGGYLFIFFIEKVAFDAHGLMNDMEGGSEKKVSQPQSATNGEETRSITRRNSETTSSHGTSSRSAVILLGALAVHSILEMTALGLADTFGDAALLSLSIALHQPAESIALLVAFLKSSLSKPEIARYLAVFSACGPVGVAIGMAVNEFAPPIFDAAMLAVVAGTFVYVGATEVIPEEWEDQEHKWKKFGSLMAGIGAILAITKYTATLEGVH